MNRRPPRHDGWDSELPPEEHLERLLPKVLHVPDVTCGLQYGVNLDEFVLHIDLLKQFRILSELSGRVDFIKTVSARTAHPVHDALIAAAHLTNTLPTQLQPDTFGQDLKPRTRTQLSASAELTRNRSVYFSNKNDDLPIVIDTCGSKSVTPVESDFIGPL